MHSPLRPLRVIMLCLLALTSLTHTSLTLTSHAQNVWTWHNDNNRTGWQQNETILTQSNVLVAKFPVPTIFKGYVYVGTQKEVDVFGLCGNPTPACAQ